MSDEAKPDITAKRKPLTKKPLPVAHAVIEISALATLAFLAYIHKDSVEVSYAAIGLIAGIVGVRWKRGDDTSGPVTAFLTAAGVLHATGST